MKIRSQITGKNKEGRSVYIETYGCAFNQSDSEAMAGVLTEAGFELTETAEEAALIILNTCTVKDRTFDRFQFRFSKLKAQADAGNGPLLLVAGCIPKALKSREMLDGVAALGPDQIGRVAELVEKTLAGAPVHWLEEKKKKENRALLPTRRMRANVEIVPLGAGCLSACTFCQTRLARGRLNSFRPGDLIRRVEEAADAGVDEVWLTGQDTGTYGRDINYSLPRLLRRLCLIPGDFRIRLGMTSPCWIYRALDEYLDAFEDPKLFKFWHVPLQSGSDRVLRHMRRGNTARQFMELADRFHKRFSDGALVTDMIVGYPTETDEDFSASVDLLKATKPAGVNRANFSARPGTAAANLPPLPVTVVKKRMARMTEEAGKVCRAWHEQWVGRIERVRIFETDTGRSNAHNQAGRPVKLDHQLEIGTWAMVRYCGAAEYHHCGQVIGKL